VIPLPSGRSALGCWLKAYDWLFIFLWEALLKQIPPDRDHDRDCEKEFGLPGLFNFLQNTLLNFDMTVTVTVTVVLLLSHTIVLPNQRIELIAQNCGARSKSRPQSVFWTTLAQCQGSLQSRWAQQLGGCAFSESHCS
jgi:hypothetical protein